MLTRPSPLSSKTTTHRTGIPIAALDISPYGTHAILAGRDILKTVQVSGASCAEDFNLRSHIVAYAATHDTSGNAVSAKHKGQLAANDVKWSNGAYDSTIATAAANGQIVIYDINRPGVELARLHEHNRQVHRLAFNPHQGAYLLSGSQDATVRLWDLRQLAVERSAATCRSIHKYSLNNEGIRDLRWSPTNGVEFAAGTDNGVIQRWDFRNDKSPVLKINAHENTCHSIDWHPDGKHLVSGGADKNVKIWDFSSTDRRMKACWQLRVPQVVMNVRWRPPCWTVNAQSTGNWQAVQFATSYDQQDPRIHLWDLRRPSMPFKEVDRYDTPATAMLWHSENLLWSVDVAGMFTQTDITYATKVLDRRSPNVIAVASSGQINLFSEQRVKPRRTLDDAPEDFLQGRTWRGSGGERFSGSYSTPDGSFEESSFLSTSFKSRPRKATSSLSSKSVTSTPPSAGTGGPVLRLDQSLQRELLYRPAQVAASGRFSGIFDDTAFEFLARKYRLPPTPPGKQVEWNLHELLSDAFNENATLAACVGQYRLAQSWRILALAVRKELRARAETNSALRRSCKRASQPSPKTFASDKVQNYRTNRIPSDEEGARSNLTAPLVQENGSNMTTPLARPILDPTGDPVKTRGIAIPDEETFQLPIPAFAKRLPKNQHSVSDLAPIKNLSDTEVSSKGALLNGDTGVVPQPVNGESLKAAAQSPLATGFLDLDHHMSERRAAMNNYRAQPRPLLRLDDPFYVPRDGVLAPSLGRHDSNESLQMFSASMDSSHRAHSAGGSSGSNQEFERSDSSPERSNIVTKAVSEERLNDTSSDMVFEGDEHRLELGDNLPCSHDFFDPMGLTTAKSFEPAPPSFIRPIRPQPPIVHTEDLDTWHDRTTSPPDQPSTLQGYFIPSDFAPPEHAPPPKPWTATAMLPQLINYHTITLSDSQTPSHLLLYLLPYFPLLIPQPLILNILLSYHNQLTSLALYSQAAHLRKLCHSSYPEIYDHGTYGISSGGAWCTICRKLNKGDKPGSCERCLQKWAPCPICNGEGPLASPCPPDLRGDTHPNILNPSASDALWGWCHICGHGGHIGCLSVWWDDPAISEGGCATLGCLHDCVAGIRRDELFQRAAEEKKAGTVKGDEWVVEESRAAEKARDLLGRRRGMQGPMSAGGIGGFGVGLEGRSHSGSGSGGKKVKLVVPEDERDGEAEREAEGEESDTKEEFTSASAP